MITLLEKTFVGKVMSMLFNMMSRLVITFLPRSKRLLISWLQSPFAVILEPQKIKSDTVSTVSPSLSHEVMGPVVNYSEIESESEVAQSCPTLCDPMGLQPTRLLSPQNFPGKSTGVGCHFLLPGDLPNPGIESRSPALQEDALLSEPPGKPLTILYME